MSWGSELSGGFSTTFGAGVQAKDLKERKKLRDEDVAFRKARAQLEDEFREKQLVRRGEEFDAQQALAEERLTQDAARFAASEKADARDFAFRRDRAASSDLAATMAASRQARQDFSGEIDKARLDPLREQLLVEQAREMQLRNDALANPQAKPVQAVERLEFDPMDPTGAPKRVITGPAGSLGAFSAPGTGEGAAVAYRGTGDVAEAYRAGKISREQAEEILKTQFGITQ